MPLVKPLCRVCERPTADGAVQAVHVDKEKLQIWFLNVCGHELAEEIEDEDLICNFCIWHAEFLARNVPELENLAWWQTNEQLDSTFKELRKNYFEGKTEQCWVQLEKIELPKSETEENSEHMAEKSIRKGGNKCFYCGQVVAKISSHVRNMHKNAIRCDYRKCSTYFHTVEEKDKHTKEVHENKLIKCNFCEKEFRQSSHIRGHIRSVHSEFRVRCKFFGCLCYFKSKPEMKVHFDAVHKKEDEAKVYSCHHCESKSKSKGELLLHISRLHLPKTIMCDKCHKMFSTKQNLAQHARMNHETRVCSICNSDVTVIAMSNNHVKRLNCKRCKNEFECSGLYQSHLKTCKTTLFKCEKCPKAFQKLSLLDYHVKREHRNKSWRGLQHKQLGFKCEPCRRYYKSEKLLKLHLNHIHKRLNLKHCAHCPKSFPNLAYLKNHLAVTHFLIERKFECDQCERKFVSSYFLAKHKRNTHLKNKTLETCELCGKSITDIYMKRHLETIHGIDNP